MAGGSLRLTVNTPRSLSWVAERVLCWAAADKQKVRVETGLAESLLVPEEVFAGKGTLLLKRGGADVLDGYVAGTNITVNVANGDALAFGPATDAGAPAGINTCTDGTVPATQPTVSAVATNVGGIPGAVTLTYANAVGAGLVDIEWGDGTRTLGAAESGAANHTYPQTPGIYTVVIRDATTATALARTTLTVP